MSGCWHHHIQHTRTIATKTNRIKSEKYNKKYLAEIERNINDTSCRDRNASATFQ